MFLQKHLSLREKAAQTAVILTAKDRFVDQPVGGIFIGAQVITEVEDGVSLVRQTVERYRRNMKTPPLVISDFENGCGSMIAGLTPMPYGMSLGAANSEQLAYDYGKATALEALTAGANATFSPVCDLNKNFRNPLVNVRAISDDPDHAIPLLKQIIRGMQEGGLAACAKHFPGDGIDWRDQHIITTVNSLSMEEWWRYSGRVFAELIGIGVSMIMPGHISLPSYQKVRKNGLALPATLSDELLTGLLKGEMGFQGVVVSDATMMGGFNGFYGSKAESEIECFKAGCDLVLWPTDGYIDNLVSAIENGYIKESRLDDALERIFALKEKYVSRTGDYPQLTEEQKRFVQGVQKDTAEKSITLVKDRNRILPVGDKVKNILIITLCNHPPILREAETLKTELENRGFSVAYYVERPEDDVFDREAKKADLIIYAMYTRSFRPVGPIDFWGDKCWAIAKSYQYGQEKSVYVSFGNPYFANQYFEKAGTYVNAYTMLEPSIKAFARALTGEIPFTDFSPVSLELDGGQPTACEK